MSPLSFQWETEEEKEGGERVRSDANVPRQVEFRKIAWKTHKAPVSEKQIWNLTLEIN